ncbi:MAG: hypothetical protein KAS32_13505 [Candidatus Peribacteraceae bacterium]|nr:hypothetical protein [Candidatus Peribacteraceae bacterium]
MSEKICPHCDGTGEIEEESVQTRQIKIINALNKILYDNHELWVIDGGMKIPDNESINTVVAGGDVNLFLTGKHNNEYQVTIAVENGEMVKPVTLQPINFYSPGLLPGKLNTAEGLIKKSLKLIGHWPQILKLWQRAVTQINEEGD